MSNIIEVEIENRSYRPFLNLDTDSRKTIRLTTLTDNQIGAVIKIFLNKNGIRIPLKEFNIAGINPRKSGLPRFELGGLYSEKTLYLELKVDGRKSEIFEIRMTPYLRNKKIPFYIVSLLVILFLFVWGGILLIKNITSPGYEQFSPDKIENVLPDKNTNRTASSVSPAVPLKQEEKKPVENKTAAEGQIKPVPPPAEPVKTELLERIIYFTPNNTSITDRASLVLDELIPILKEKKAAAVEISGHCALSGTEAGRERLSRERAFTTLNYLKKEGWAPEKELIIKWYGGTRLISSNPDEIYRNRRVEIKITF